MLNFNALIVAGGQSSRLGGTPKSGLSNGQQTLLESTLAAVEDATYRVVVGPDSLPLPADVLQTLEKPRFSGPAAAIAAGVLALPADAASWTLVLSVDMPNIRQAITPLLKAAQEGHTAQGFMGISENIVQPLAGIYCTDALRPLATQDVANKSVRRWLGQLKLQQVELPAGSTRDVDTWEQAEASGYIHPQW